MDTSIVVTCFNEGERLRRAVESLRRQSDTDFETLIVNDGSPDETTNRVCRELEAQGGARVIWRARNGGLSAARNTGFEAMRGGICVPLDADDTLPPDALAAIRETFRKHPDADFVFGNYLRHDLERGTRQEVDCSALGRGGLLAPETLASREWIFYGGSPCRKEMWRKLGGYRAEYSYDTQDLDFWMRAMTGGFKGYYAGRVIYEWRRSSTGMNERTSPASRVRTRVHNIAFYDRFGDGIGARREFLLNAISHREYDCAKEMAAQLLQRRRPSPLVLFIRVAPPPVIRGAHALWLRARLPRPR